MAQPLTGRWNSLRLQAVFALMAISFFCAPGITFAASAPTLTFNAYVSPAGAVRLLWWSSGADHCTARGAWNGVKALHGIEESGAYSAPAIYLLTCSGAGGTTTQLAVVRGLQPVVNFSASHASVTSGTSSVLTWSVVNARTCSASGDWSGPRATSGFQSTGALLAGRTYTLTCTGDGGTVNRVVSVDVVQQAPVSVTLTAHPPSVPLNGSTTLSWTSTGATGCSASGGWAGSRAVSGSATVGPITEDTTFALTCSGGDRSALRMAAVMLREHRLTWLAPTHNVDGTPLTDLASFRIHYGNASRRYTQTITVGGTTRAHTIRLTPGTWHFAVTAVNSRGEESAYSNEFRRVIP